jgi:HSP20 family protein
MATQDMERRTDTPSTHAEKTYTWPTVTPRVDIIETPDAYVLKAEMPGADPASINAHYDKGVLTLHADRTLPTTQGDCLYQEFQPCSFERVFTVSDVVDAGKIAAQYTLGVLTLTLPKAEAAKPRRITITAS